MRRRIEKYAVFYNVAANEGHILFQLDDNIEGQGTATLLLDSPQEGMFVLDILRNEQPVYYDEEHQIIMTGLEFTGEGET